DAEKVFPTFEEGDVVAVGGRAHLFQDKLQISIDNLAPVPKDMTDAEDCLPTSRYHVEAMYAELLTILEGLKNPYVRELGLALLNDRELAARYKVCPAAKTIHHAFIGGLLFHSLQLIKLADAILPLYTDIDRDLLIFGCA